MGRIILPDENRLVKQLRERDNDAIKDILQNIFVKILKNLNHFVFLGAGSLQAWIGRIATNESIEYLRQKNRERWVALDWDVPDEPEQEDPLSMTLRTFWVSRQIHLHQICTMKDSWRNELRQKMKDHQIDPPAFDLQILETILNESTTLQQPTSATKCGSSRSI